MKGPTVPHLSPRARTIATVALSAALVVGPTAAVANAAGGHWHTFLQPAHYDRSRVWLGTPFPFTVDFKYTTAYSGCLHTDVVIYREALTGANDTHLLRHAHC